MKRREYIISQIQHRETKPVPCTLSMEPDVASRLDEYYGDREWRKRLPRYMASYMKVDTRHEVEIGDYRVRDAFGGVWRLDRRPWYLEEAPLKERSFRDFKFPSVAQFVEPIHENKEKAIEKIKADSGAFHYIGMGWGIFEQTWRLRGFENALIDAVEEPAFYSELAGRIAELYVEMVKACADVPADAFLFGDDWGEQRGVILGPDRWRNLIKPHWAKVYAEVHKQGKYVMTHCCGSIADIMSDIVEIGVDVLESVQPEAVGMCPYQLKEAWGDRITFWGCLGSQSIIPYGTPQQIKAQIRKLCAEVGKGGGFIVTPAKPLQPETPTENAAAIVEEFARPDL